MRFDLETLSGLVMIVQPRPGPVFLRVPRMLESKTACLPGPRPLSGAGCSLNPVRYGWAQNFILLLGFIVFAEGLRMELKHK